MTRRHNITQPDVRCRFAPRRDCRDLSQNTTPRNRLRPVLMPRPLENKRLARAAVRGATLLLPSPNRSRLLPTSVTLLGGRTLAIARFGWGGVRDGGRRMWHACATASRPPTPTLPHKGGSSGARRTHVPRLLRLLRAAVPRGVRQGKCKAAGFFCFYPPIFREGKARHTNAITRARPPVESFTFEAPTTRVAPASGTLPRLATFSSPQRPDGSQI